MKRLSVTAASNERRRRRRDRAAGTRREGRNRERDGLLVSEGREHQEQGKVDERGKERGKLRESGEEERRTAQQVSPGSIPLTAAVIQAGRGSLSRQQQKKIYIQEYCIFLFFSLWGRNQRTPWRGQREHKERGIRELLQPPSVLQEIVFLVKKTKKL